MLHQHSRAEDVLVRTWAPLMNPRMLPPPPAEGGRPGFVDGMQVPWHFLSGPYPSLATIPTCSYPRVQFLPLILLSSSAASTGRPQTRHTPLLERVVASRGANLGI